MSDRPGRYTLVRPLGRGAMGEVWEAWLEGPQGFRKPVALKRLRAGPRDATDREALLQEARLGALLHHPNVVGVYALEELDEGWTIVMELVRGASLSELLTHGPLSARAVIDVGMQAARGLVHIHELRLDGRTSGLVHRDIKPSNLLVDRTGLVKVADLGVSSLAGDGSIVGTAGYMAPEQWLGQGDARVDLFALGVTLYHCATGTLPFGRDLDELRQPGWVARRLEDPDTLVAADRAVPGLAAVLGRCLAADPDRRFRTALAVLDALVELSTQQLTGPSLPSMLLAHRPDLDVDPSTRAEATLETAIRTRGNLPPEPNAFVGRETELDALRVRIHEEPLLTLVGPGGMGKTRLARRAAASVQGRLSGGAWFIDLSEARSVDGICSAAARDLGLQLDQSDPVAQLGWALEARGVALFVLDNLEQCVEPVRTLVQRWRRSAPRARFLCTSRIALGVPAESVLKLGPLAEDEALALFLDRSPAVVPAADRDELRALVGELDGLPLAIELVAARTRLVPVPALRARLGLRLLAGGASDRPERHRSLDACLRWSWELLAEPHRQALVQLSVFDGAFDLAAAEAVLELPAKAGWALDALGVLVDASLVRVDPDAGRFGLLNVVRSFAETRLEPRTEVEARHGRWYAQLLSDAHTDDLDNLMVGCQRAVRRGDADTARGCALGAWFLLELRGPVAAAIPLIEAALASAGEGPQVALETARMGALCAVGRSPEGITLGEAALVDAADASPLERSELLHDLGMARFGLGQLAEATELLETALPLCRAAGDRGAEGSVRTSIGAVLIESGRTTEAQRSLELALVALREVGDRRTEGRALGYLGSLNQRLGQYLESAECFARALVLLRETGDHRQQAVVLGNLGVLDRTRGDFEQARAHQEEALAVHRRAGNRAQQALAHTNLGNLNVQLGDLDRARARYEAAIAVTREVGDRRTEAVATGNLGHVQAIQGDAEAETNLRTAITLLGELGDRRIQGHMMGHLAKVCGPSDPDQALALLDEAEVLLQQTGDPVMLAAMFLIRAEVLHGAGDSAGAAVALARAEQFTPPDHVEVQAQLASTRALLDGTSG